MAPTTDQSERIGQNLKGNAGLRTPPLSGKSQSKNLSIHENRRESDDTNDYPFNISLFSYSIPKDDLSRQPILDERLKQCYWIEKICEFPDQPELETIDKKKLDLLLDTFYLRDHFNRAYSLFDTGDSKENTFIDLILMISRINEKYPIVEKDDLHNLDLIKTLNSSYLYQYYLNLYFNSINALVLDKSPGGNTDGLLDSIVLFINKTVRLLRLKLKEMQNMRANGSKTPVPIPKSEYRLKILIQNIERSRHSLEIDTKTSQIFIGCHVYSKNDLQHDLFPSPEEQSIDIKQELMKFSTCLDNKVLRFDDPPLHCHLIEAKGGPLSLNSFQNYIPTNEKSGLRVTWWPGNVVKLNIWLEQDTFNPSDLPEFEGSCSISSVTLKLSVNKDANLINENNSNVKCKGFYRMFSSSDDLSDDEQPNLDEHSPSNSQEGEDLHHDSERIDNEFENKFSFWSNEHFSEHEYNEKQKMDVSSRVEKEIRDWLLIYKTGFPKPEDILNSNSWSLLDYVVSGKYSPVYEYINSLLLLSEYQLKYHLQNILLIMKMAFMNFNYLKFTKNTVKGDSLDSNTHYSVREALEDALIMDKRTGFLGLDLGVYRGLKLQHLQMIKMEIEYHIRTKIDELRRPIDLDSPLNRLEYTMEWEDIDHDLMEDKIDGFFVDLEVWYLSMKEQVTERNNTLLEIHNLRKCLATLSLEPDRDMIYFDLFHHPPKDFVVELKGPYPTKKSQITKCVEAIRNARNRVNEYFYVEPET